MPTKHVDKLIEPYLDQQLSATTRRQVEAHVRVCPTCAHRLFSARRIDEQLGPVMQAALGKPSPRPMLRHEIKNRVSQNQPKYLGGWAGTARFLNAVGTVAAIAVLAFGAVAVLQSQLAQEEPVSAIRPLTPNNYLFTSTPTPEPPVQPNPTVAAVQGAALSDTLPTPTVVRVAVENNPPRITETGKKVELALAGQTEPEDYVSPKNNSPAFPALPGGTIAFALYNPTPGRQLYEIHFINPDGSQHQTFPLDGVSEPALHPANTNQNLAFRAWTGPTSPRSLLTGDMANQQFESVTNFWEDAQPDWSPTENRIIFASQRESDRRWRLYTVWGDGSLEVNLRREGKAPTFAPDGYRFAFESCNRTGLQCGLWLADLDHSEQGSTLLLADPLAKAPDWSPQAEEVAYMANPNSNWDLYLVESDGRKVRRLTDHPASDGLPAWSPNGEWLAFVSNRDGAWAIWLLHVSSGTLRHVHTFENGSITPPKGSMPYSEHGERYWWDEQLSWGP